MRRPAIEDRWSRPAVMGIVNVTPDSFSDGGRTLAGGAPRPASGCSPTGPRSSTSAVSRRARERARERGEELARVVPVLELPGRPARLDRHLQGGGRAARARAGATHGERRHGPARRPRHGGRRRRAAARPLPDAHAGRRRRRCRPRRATRTSSPRSSAFLGERLATRSPRASTSERIWLDPGSASARPPTRTCGSSAGSTRSSRLDDRCWWGSRGRARSPGPWASRTRSSYRTSASVGAAVRPSTGRLPVPRARRPAHVEALAVRPRWSGRRVER